MKETSDNSDSLQDRFKQFEFAPSDEVWGGISQGLSAEEKGGFLAEQFAGFVYPPRKAVWKGIAGALRPARRRIAPLWWAVAASVAVLLLFGGIWWMNGNSGGIQNQISGLNSSPAIGMDSINGEAEPPSLPDQNIPRDKSLAGANNQEVDKNPGSLTPNLNKRKSSNKSDASPEPSAYDGEDFAEVSTPRGSIPLAIIGYRPNQLFTFVAAREGAQRLPKSEEAILNEIEQAQQALVLAVVEFREVPEEPKHTIGYEPGLAANISPNLGLPALASSIESMPITDLAFASTERFSLPVIVGAHLNLRLRKRWSLGTGLVYTLVNSTDEASSVAGAESLRLTRQYLGIALSGNFDFLQRKRVSLYLSSGVQYDFGVRKDTRSRTVASDGAIVTHPLSSQPLGNQASAFAGMGLDYRVVSFVHLFAQASARHYFYQSHETYWSQKPVWPSVQMGIRLVL